MKKIKSKLLLCINSMVLVAVLITGGVASYMNYSSTVSSLRQTMTITAQIAANQIAAELKAYVNLVSEFAYNSVLLEGASIQERLNQLHSLQENQGFAAVRMVSADGIDLETGEDISGFDYFTELKNTRQPQISEPTLDTNYDEMLIFINVPILKDGQFFGMIMGGIKADFLSRIVSNIKVGDGTCAILDKSGTTIAYHDYTLVEQQYNTQNEVKNDPQLTRLAALEASMMKGEAGFSDYAYGGVEKFLAYCPIPDSNGWSLEVTVVREEFMSGTMQSLYLTIGIMLALVAVAVLVSIRMSNSIAKPIMASADRLALLAQGDLDSDVAQVKAKDETGLLAASLSETVENLRRIIRDITQQLGAMAQGNFTEQSEMQYVGGFLPIQTAMTEISDALNDAMGQIDQAADQVSSGSDQVSAGAQALSQGATEQASSVEELAATIQEIASQVKENAETARQASQRVGQVAGEMTDSNEKMTEMIKAMDEISAQSTEIGKIIKTIEDIAFQTNILALNAAVEAARAGAAGKGFAVVADEVRNLANKSQDASKNTAVLIERSLGAVREGNRIAEETALSLREAVEGAGVVAESISRISSASAEQAESIDQVNLGVEQISAVVQTNSATAEESAAASEELSSQAEMLKSQLARFTLRQNR